MTNLSTKLWHIQQCPLFEAMSTEEKAAVGSASEMIELPKNKVIPPPPASDPSLYVVKKGHIQLSYTDLSGKEAVVILLGPGDVFGSLDPEEAPFGEHCRTVSDACICRISQFRFDGLLRKYPDLAYRLTKFSMLRINRLQVRLAEMMMRQADQRLALALLDLDRQVGRELPDGRKKLGLSLTHADLGKLIGTSREMVSILFKKFREKNLVEVEKGWIYLVDCEALRRLADNQEP
ncbi:MAG: Crp/Fnr family transcriptional regulator [Candidatus Sumerlaeia bacterium]|nr:Crp/Fnr family transcriptional regulator [Candidatus Sumerlaeia bacterium]